MEKIKGLKKWLKQWEQTFVMENKHRPTAEDIRSAPKEVIDAYKRYADAKKLASGSRGMPSGKICLKESSQTAQSQISDSFPTTNLGTEAEASGAEMVPWGAELNKKEEKLTEEVEPSKEAEVDFFMQNVGHKLLAKANLSVTQHRTKTWLRRDGCSPSESTTTEGFGYSSEPKDHIAPSSLFGKVKKLAEMRQTARQMTSVEGGTSPRPTGGSMEEVDDSLSQNFISMHQSRLSKSAKRLLANSRLTGEPETLAAFAGEILASHTEFVPEEEISAHVNSSSGFDTSVVFSSDNTRTDSFGHRTSPSVSQPSGHSGSGQERTYTDTNRHKRKASGSLDASQSKKRMIVTDNFDAADEFESNALMVESQSHPEATETAETDLERPTICKTKTTQRKPVKRSVVSTEGNFVRLNMKVKKYKRKGFRAMTGGAYKRQEWKKRMQGRQEGNSGNKCFKCGQAGHWAKNCKNSGRTTSTAPVEMENAPSLSETARKVDDSLFPTMNEAIRMSRGIRVTAGTPDAVNYVDRDCDEEELSVVRTLDDRHEAPPAAQPLYQLEEDGRVPDATPEVFQVLKRFGFDSFRAGQEKVIMRVLCGLSTLVVLSTGAGKSLCYQLPAFMYGQRAKSITLVISPLVSLMDDQVMGLPPGVNGACLHTNLSKPQREKVVSALVDGEYHFLLISPETLVGSGATSTLPSIDRMPPIAFACIDEVHCVSEWSHHFRPSYLRLCKVLKERYGVKCVLGLTATATMATIRSISHNLEITDFEEATVRGKAMPDNLHLSISRDDDKDKALINLLCGGRFSTCQSIIIYCTRRQQTDNVASLIRTHMKETAPPDLQPPNKAGKKTAKKKAVKGVTYMWTAESYHAGLTPSARRRVQNAFMSGKLRVVVATVAFGMGLDKSDVRGIIHYNLPKSFESYVQEIGRAGRDGKSAFCHVFLDRELLVDLFSEIHPEQDFVGCFVMVHHMTCQTNTPLSHDGGDPWEGAVQFLGRDMNELKRHIYSNTVDRSAIKKLLRDVFLPCRCREAQQRQQNKEGSHCSRDVSMTTGRLCPGHERAIPVDATVQKMDMKEEGIDTLLCYLELHEKRWLETLQPVYATCTLTCYGGAAQLQAVARKCPPVAIAIATEKRRGVSHAHCSRLQFSVVELSDRVGWNSGLVKRELKQLQWGVTELGQPRKSGVLVEFSDLAFHLRSPGDLTDTERDEVTAFLVDRLVSQEATELRNLQLLYNTFYRVSHTDVWMCMDEIDEDRSNRLKESIFKYFDQHSKMTADTGDMALMSSEDGNETGQLPPVLFKITESLGSARADIGNFISLYGSEHRLSGRAIARVFHGIPSPCFPAEVWGRVRRFWRSYLHVDFNVLRKLATQELLHYI